VADDADAAKYDENRRVRERHLHDRFPVVGVHWRQEFRTLAYRGTKMNNGTVIVLGVAIGFAWVWYKKKGGHR
jgi:hypothetical protein